MLDFLNVRLVVSNTGQPRPRTLQRIWSRGLGSFRLWRNPDALPRWFFAEGADFVADRDLAAWIAGMKNPRRVAVRPEEMDPAPTVGDRLLATSLPGPAGWRALGSPGAARLLTLTVNGAYLGVRVPAEVKAVRLTYRPPGFEIGLVLASFALVVIGGLFVLAHRKPGLRYDRREILAS